MYESVLKMVNVRANIKMWTSRISTNQYQKDQFRKYKIRIAKSRRITRGVFSKDFISAFSISLEPL